MKTGFLNLRLYGRKTIHGAFQVLPLTEWFTPCGLKLTRRIVQKTFTPITCRNCLRTKVLR